MKSFNRALLNTNMTLNPPMSKQIGIPYEGLFHKKAPNDWALFILLCFIPLKVFKIMIILNRLHTFIN